MSSHGKIQLFVLSFSLLVFSLFVQIPVKCCQNNVSMHLAYLIFAKDGRKSSERWDQEMGARDHSFAGLLAFFCFCGFQDVSGCKKRYMLAFSSASVNRCCFFPEEKEGQFRHSSKTKMELQENKVHCFMSSLILLI